MTSGSKSSTSHDISRGDLFWVGEGGDKGSSSAELAHPYLVIQEDVFNRSRLPTIIVCALTSNLRRATEHGNVLLDLGEGGLPRQSVIVVSRIEAFERGRLSERIGRLSSQRVDQAIAGLAFQQRSFFRE